MKMKLRSLSDAVAYIREKLGEPVINVELTNAQIQQCVIDSVQNLHRYLTGEAIYEDILTVELKAGQKSYPMPDEIHDAVELHTNYSGDVNELFTAEHQVLMETGILPQLLHQTTGNSVGMELSGYDIATKNLELVKRFFSKDFTVNFHPQRKEMVVNPTPTQNIFGALYVWKKEALEDLVDHPLLKELMVAETKILWGGVLGKYQLSLPGGGTIIGTELKQEGKEEKKEVKETFFEEQEPLGFWIG